jgi:tetratricopeptide (TPR) repeat protein
MQALGSALLVAAIISLGACGPSASVKRTTPVANLQSYQTALVRVSSASNLSHYTPVLEFATSDALQKRCSFERVVSPTQIGADQPDLILDLNIRSTARGGDGFIKNPNLATVSVTMVLSDGIDESLLGSAEIIGKSAAVAIEGNDPENQALIAVAKRITAILGKSGCEGTRVARAVPPPVEEPVAAPPGAPELTPEQLAEAEAANDEGKRLFRAAEIAAAKSQFEKALGVAKDPRFFFNLCLAHEALTEYESAVNACNSVLSANPNERLVQKANQRLEIIADKRGA